MKWLSLSLYVIGMWGILVNKSSIIKVLLSIELMLIGVTLMNLLTSMLIDDVVGWVFGIIILTVAASESAIGLGLLISYNASRGSLEVKNLNLLKK